MRRALVLGYGESGKAAELFLRRRGWDVVLADRQAGVGIFADSDFLALEGVELVVASPGVPPTQRLYAETLARGIPLIGEVELGLQAMKQRAVGITGTNGKTTVTLLAAHALNRCGLQAVPVGNVGTPLTQAVDNAPREAIFVIELSSWQLETVSTQGLDAGIVLNITPDHLDRHMTMEAYARAKARIQKALKPAAALYLHPEAARDFGHCFDRPFSVYAVPGSWVSHDGTNAYAACLLCQTFGVSEEDFFKAVHDFRKPSHRLEFVTSCCGVSYVDDSKGTNVDAVVKAVQSVQGQVLLIAGGVDKQTGYQPWQESFPGRVKAVFVIGEAAVAIQASLGTVVPVTLCTSLQQAVALAAKAAQAGETVLLSPGCASYDMFENYKHRGMVYQDLVRQLCEQKEGL